eukprot:gene8006-9516_t
MALSRDPGSREGAHREAPPHAQNAFRYYLRRKKAKLKADAQASSTAGETAEAEKGEGGESESAIPQELRQKSPPKAAMFQQMHKFKEMVEENMDKIKKESDEMKETEPPKQHKRLKQLKEIHMSLKQDHIEHVGLDRGKFRDDKRSDDDDAAPKTLHRPPYYCLKTFETPSDQFKCNLCDEPQPKSAVMSGCRTCNYDVCAKCRVPTACLRGHSVHTKSSDEGVFLCNICGEEQPLGSTVIGCNTCDWDICQNCQVPREDQKESQPKSSLYVTSTFCFSWTIKWMWDNTRTDFFKCLCSILLIGLWSATSPFLTTYLFDTAIVQQLWFQISYLVPILIIGQLFMAHLEMRLTLDSPSGGKFLPAMQERLLQHILGTSATFLETLNVSYIMSMMDADLATLNENIDSCLLLLSISVRMVLLLIGLGYISWHLTVVLMAALPIFLVYNQMVGSRVTAASDNLRKAEKLFAFTIEENITRAQLRRVMGLGVVMEPHVQGDSQFLAQCLEEFDLFSAQTIRGLSLCSVAFTFSIVVAGMLLITRGSLSLGTFTGYYLASGSVDGYMISFTQAASRMTASQRGRSVWLLARWGSALRTARGSLALYRLVCPVPGVARLWHAVEAQHSESMTSLNKSKSSLATVLELLGQILDTPEQYKNFSRLTEDDLTTKMKMQSREFVLKDVCFSRITETGVNKQILKNISFSLPQGEKVGVVGASGTGKTTMLKLMQRLYRPSSGHIELGGQILETLDIPSIIATLEQETLLFDGSVAYNIAIGTKGTIKQVMEAADIAMLSRDVEKHDESFLFDVGPNGRLLSTGTRQRVGIARCILRSKYYGRRVLLMDEPTSAQEPKVVSQLSESLATMLPDITVIIITHTLTLLERFSYILVLHDGILVESGSQEELLKMKGRWHSMLDNSNGLSIDARGNAKITPARLMRTWLFASPKMEEDHVKRMVEVFVSRNCVAGEVLCTQGISSDTMVILVAGAAAEKLNSVQGEEMLLRTWHPGHSAGEDSLLSPTSKWQTTVTFTSDSTILMLQRKFFEKALEGNTDLKAIVEQSVANYEEGSQPARLALIWPFATLNAQQLQHLSAVMTIQRHKFLDRYTHPKTIAELESATVAMEEAMAAHKARAASVEEHHQIMISEKRRLESEISARKEAERLAEEEAKRIAIERAHQVAERHRMVQPDNLERNWIMSQLPHEFLSGLQHLFNILVVTEGGPVIDTDGTNLNTAYMVVCGELAITYRSTDGNESTRRHHPGEMINSGILTLDAKQTPKESPVVEWIRKAEVCSSNACVLLGISSLTFTQSLQGYDDEIMVDRLVSSMRDLVELRFKAHDPTNIAEWLPGVTLEEARMLGALAKEKVVKPKELICDENSSKELIIVLQGRVTVTRLNGIVDILGSEESFQTAVMQPEKGVTKAEAASDKAVVTIIRMDDITPAAIEARKLAFLCIVSGTVGATIHIGEDGVNSAALDPARTLQRSPLPTRIFTALPHGARDLLGLGLELARSHARQKAALAELPARVGCWVPQDDVYRTFGGGNYLGHDTVCLPAGARCHERVMSAVCEERTAMISLGVGQIESLAQLNPAALDDIRTQLAIGRDAIGRYEQLAIGRDGVGGSLRAAMTEGGTIEPNVLGGAAGAGMIELEKMKQDMANRSNHMKHITALRQEIKELELHLGTRNPFIARSCWKKINIRIKIYRTLGLLQAFLDQGSASMAASLKEEQTLQKDRRDQLRKLRRERISKLEEFTTLLKRGRRSGVQLHEDLLDSHLAEVERLRFGVRMVTEAVVDYKAEIAKTAANPPAIDHCLTNTKLVNWMRRREALIMRCMYCWEYDKTPILE